MVSAPSVLSGAVALMSLSVKSSLADAMAEKGKAWAWPSLPVSLTLSPSTPSSVPENCLRPSQRLGERDARLVAGPVGEILEPGQRPVDARRADFEPVAALDRVVGVEPVGQAARNRLAIGKVELAGVGALGHHLQRRVGRAADHRHAHELIAEALHLGLDPLGDGLQCSATRRSARKSKSLSDRGRWAPASGI